MPPSSSHGNGGRPPTAVRTSFLLANLHCPTCVSTIKRVLHDSSADHVRWVSPNVVTSVVTVEHDQAIAIQDMAAALEEAGFEVSGVSSSPPDSLGLAETPRPASNPRNAEQGGPAQHMPRPASALGRWMSRPRIPARGHIDQPSLAEAHLQNCEQCRKAKEQGLDEKCGLDEKDTSCELPRPCHAPGPLPSSNKAGAASSQSAIMSTKSFVTVDTDATTLAQPAAQPAWKASLAIGGMTCAACVNTITDEMRKRDWVRDITVNLITNSATVEFIGKENAEKLVESIEDLGYDATMDSVVPLEEEKAPPQERTVEILVDGLYCEHCPGRVTSSLAGFRRQLEIVAKPSPRQPILKIAYVPEAPDFTIRHILAAIEASDPALKATIYHPPSLEERSKRIQRKHQLQILYRVVFTGVICVPTFVIGIAYMSLVPGSSKDKHFLMKPWTSGISRAQIALFIMATPVYFYGANLFHTRAFKEIKSLWRPGSRTPVLQRFYRFGSMNTLMSLGTSIAYISSVSQLLAAAAHHPQHINNANFYFDSVVFLTFFLLLGRLIESYSRSKTGDAVEMLGRLRPTEAILAGRPGGGPEEKDTVVQADLLDFGDVVRVPHGASPPADGTVVQGESKFDESSLTGESHLISKGPGDQVFSGTVNKDAPVLVQITGASGASMLDQIVKVVREGQTRRAPMEQIADLLTAYFVPMVTLVAILTWVIWMGLGLSGRIPDGYLDVSSGGWVAFALQFAIAVFVVACPCGLALAAPTAIFVGGGMAAQHGILAKGGGEAFETASRVDCVVFDKTGTLTVGGLPTVTDAETYPGGAGAGAERQDAGPLLAALKAVEENSSHPVAKAIVAYCEAQGAAAQVTVEDLQEIPGRGMRAVYRTGAPGPAFEILVGNEALLQDFAVPVPAGVAGLLQRWKSEAKSVALAATRPAPPGAADARAPPGGWAVAASLAVSDPIRPEAPAVVRVLQARGTRVWMLSGDNAVTAAAVAARIGIPADRVISGVLPAQKADKIKYLQTTLRARAGRGGRESATRRATVAMVGDGINDSPALTAADVGVAIGSGSDVAISSAAFVLVRSDLRAAVALLDLSAAVFRRIKLNFGWALVYNVLAVPIAAGVLYPIVSDGKHVRLDPVWASLAMALSSISVVTSSLLLRSPIPGIGYRARAIEVPGS